MEQPKNNARILVVTAVVIVVLGLLATLLLGQSKTLDVSHVNRVSDSFSTAAPYKNGSFIVASRGGLTAYNPSTDKKVVLVASSTTSGMDQVDSLSASSGGRYILFHTNFVAENTTLSQLLIAQQKDPSGDYWWVYDTDSKSFTALSAGILVARFSGENVVGLAQGQAGETLTTYTAKGLLVTSTPITNASDFYPVDGGYLLQTSGGKLLFTANGLVSKTLMTSNAIVGVTTDKQYVLITQPDGEKQSLVQVKLSDYSTKVIAENVSGSQSWLGTGVVLYTPLDADENRMLATNIVTGETVNWSIHKTDSAAKFSPVALLSTSTAIATNQSNNVEYMVSDRSFDTLLENL